jgi:hypothetical protein
LSLRVAYPLLIRSNGLPVVAVHVDDHPAAVRVLQTHGFRLLDEPDLYGPPGHDEP